MAGQALDGLRALSALCWDKDRRPEHNFLVFVNFDVNLSFRVFIFKRLFVLGMYF